MSAPSSPAKSKLSLLQQQTHSTIITNVTSSRSSSRTRKQSDETDRSPQQSTSKISTTRKSRLSTTASHSSTPNQRNSQSLDSMSDEENQKATHTRSTSSKDTTPTTSPKKNTTRRTSATKKNKKTVDSDSDDFVVVNMVSPSPLSSTSKRSNKSNLATKEDGKKASTTKSPNTSRNSSRHRKSAILQEEFVVSEHSDVEPLPKKPPTRKAPAQRSTSRASLHNDLSSTARTRPHSASNMGNREGFMNFLASSTDEGDHVVESTKNRQIARSPRDTLKSPAPNTPAISTLSISSPLRKPSAAEQRTTNFIGLAARFVLIITILISSLYCVQYLAKNMPDMDPEQAKQIKIPTKVDEYRILSSIFQEYNKKHPFYVFFLFAALYIFFQAFTIPLAVFLSILAGPIWGVWKGIFIISLVATIGSSFAYLIHSTIGKPLILHFFPKRVAAFKQEIDKEKDNLFTYIIFLRIMPVFPNWLVTISCPVLSVPWAVFAAGTFFGIMPNNYIMTTIGTELENATENGLRMSNSSIFSLLVISFVALIPVLLKKRNAQNADKNLQ